MENLSNNNQNEALNDNSQTAVVNDSKQAEVVNDIKLAEKVATLDSILEPTDLIGSRPVKKESEKRNAIREQFPVFAMISFFYAVFYTVCMYHNLAGITSSIMVLGSVGVAYFVLRKLGYEFGKKHIIYGVILTLLGINLFITMDPFLHFVDYVAIIMVFVSGVFSVVYDTSSWDLGDSVKAIITHIFASLGNIFDIGFDFARFSKEKDKKTGAVTYIVIGIIVTVPLLAIVLALLGGADAVFGNMLSSIFEDFYFGDVFGIAFLFVGALLGFYAWMTYFVDDSISVSKVDKRTKEPIILIVVGVSLGLVYLLFCGIQIVYLFAGVGELPQGYTYAEYAREGFAQLMFVCLINLLVVLVGVKYFKENVALKVILTIITGCTYFMIVSSAYKMYMYVNVYQMSVLRIWVLWTLVWLTFILTGALITIYNKHFSLFLFSMIATSVLYLAFAYARPANLVATYNLSDRYEQEKIDYRYIITLNEDATSAILRYYEAADAKGKEDIIRFFADGEERREYKTTVRNFNISRVHYYNQKLR